LETYEQIMEKYLRKQARADGVVAQILSKTKIPKMCRVRQKFDDAHITNIEEEVVLRLQRPRTLDTIKPGQSIAITAGSREIANIDRITRAVVDEVKSAGGAPFIIPAMGSHGGATNAGQLKILAGYGITEETMGCPVRATMETVQVGTSEDGLPVFVDRYASEADGIIVVCRIKPHTAFRGKYESGILKMITIGLGKQKGAEVCHAQGFQHMARNLVNIARVILQKCHILFAVATIENAYDETKKDIYRPGRKNS